MSQMQGLKRTPRSARAQHQAARWRCAIVGLGLLAPLAALAQADHAGTAARNAARPVAAPASVPTIAEPAPPTVDNSYLDGPLLYQLLLAELALRESQPEDAIELMVDAARRNKDDALFRRALQIAVEAGASDKALTITKSWRQTLPRSTEALRTQVQLLLALDRVGDTAEPLKQLLALSPAPERTALISSLPRAALRAKDKQAAMDLFRELLQPWLEVADARVAARVAIGRMRLNEGQTGLALELAAQAQALDPKALPPVLLALDIMNASNSGGPGRAAAPASAGASAAAVGPAAAGSARDNIGKAEAIVRTYLGGPDAEPVVRQAFASVLAGQQRLSDAADQLRLATQANPQQAQLWLGLGEIELELRQPVAAESDLQQALALAQAQQAPASAPVDDDAADNTEPSTAPADTPPPPAGNALRPGHIRLLLARAAEQRHDDAAAARWLAQIDAKDADMQVVSLRATLLARQGKLAEALKQIRSAPATTPAEQRYKLLTEVQLLLDEKKLTEARNVLTKANQESPDDVDLIYQEAMVDERLNQLDDMEILLRRILVLQPDNSQALNALGYSLADRNLRLQEALDLVRQAHELSPADPFIVDSLGWVEYRLGHFDTAANLLAQAYSSRKDTEIAAHLGEALWAGGKHTEAAQVLRDAHKLDAGNEVLKKTMARLKVAP